MKWKMKMKPAAFLMAFVMLMTAARPSMTVCAEGAGRITEKVELEGSSQDAERAKAGGTGPSAEETKAEGSSQGAERTKAEGSGPGAEKAVAEGSGYGTERTEPEGTSQDAERAETGGASQDAEGAEAVNINANARYGGSGLTADAYECFAPGEKVQLWGLTNTYGYGERQYIFALKNGDNSLLDSWAEGVMGTQDGVPYFCIEADIDYNNSVLADVCEGLDYLSQDVITECALACRYMEEHIGEIASNKTDLFFLQQCAIWTIRENHGYRAYSVQSNYVAPYTVSHNGDINFAFAFVQNSIAWAVANKENYVGYCKVLDNHAGQKCGVFKAEKKARGILELRKSSTDPAISGGNDCYSLEGAEYTVFRPGTVESVGTVTTNAEGYGRLENLDAGSYEVLETNAPRGYLADHRRHAVTIQENAVTVLETADRPGNDPVACVLVKRDAEAGTAQGGATLEGAEYTVRYYDVSSDTDPAASGREPRHTWVLKTDAAGRILLDDEHKVSGDAWLVDSGTGLVTLPLGTVTLQETKAPQGYLLNDAVYVARVTMRSGTVITAGLPDGDTDGAEEQISRGDLTFRKLNGDDGTPMKGIPFSITSRSTGESHIVISDENGVVSTGAASRPHSRNTNAGQSGSDGVWFGTAAPEEDRGALLYDSYLIEELSCVENYGKDPVEFEVAITENGKTVDVGTVQNRTIRTETKAATGPGGAQTITDVRNAQIIDTFCYENLTAGREYTVKGFVREPETGRIIEQGGKPVTAEKSFRPAGEKGSVELTFSLDAAELEGKRVVITEKLYCKGTEVARHENLQDPAQTVAVLTGDLTVTKVIAAEKIRWEHGDPTFIVEVIGTTLAGKTCTFSHMFHFTRDYVEKNRAATGEITLSHTFEEIPLSDCYRVEEVKVSRYALASVGGNGDNVRPGKNSADSRYYAEYAEVDLTARPEGTEAVFKNRKSNDGWLGHNDQIQNVIR